MEYQVMQHAEGRKFVPAVCKREGKPLIYDNAARAAEVAKQLSKLTGIKHQPRPLKAKEDWRERERSRFKSGEYQPLPWVKEPWWKDVPDHFAHISIKDKTKVAFTPDAEKGEADRQTQISAGKYLQQFFGNVLSQEEIRDFALQHSVEFEGLVLQFARTPEEIQTAYRPSTGGSCFSGTNLAMLYGSGDWAVAHLNDANGKQIARTICCPDRRIWVRIYGDAVRLGAILKKMGYRHSETGKDYNGLRLLQKHWWNGWYVDFHPYRAVDDEKEPKKFKVVQVN